MSLRRLLNVHVLPRAGTDTRLNTRDHRLYCHTYHQPLMTVTELARDLRISKETARRSVLRLEDTGWVYTYLPPGRSRGRLVIPWMPLQIEHHLASLLAQRRTTAQFFGEWLMRCMLDLSVKDVNFVDNAYPPWLITPNKGVRLELDRWYEAANVAFEFQGRQHFQKGDDFVQTDSQLSRRLEYDGEKIRLCSLQKVQLVEVRAFDLDFHRFRELISGKLPLIPVRESGPLFRELTGMSRQYISYIQKSNGR